MPLNQNKPCPKCGIGKLTFATCDMYCDQSPKCDYRESHDHGDARGSFPFACTCTQMLSTLQIVMFDPFKILPIKFETVYPNRKYPLTFTGEQRAVMQQMLTDLKQLSKDMTPPPAKKCDTCGHSDFGGYSSTWIIQDYAYLNMEIKILEELLKGEVLYDHT